MADRAKQAQICAVRAQAELDVAVKDSASVAGMYETMQTPGVRAVLPAALTDIDAKLVS